MTGDFDDSMPEVSQHMEIKKGAAYRRSERSLCLFIPGRSFAWDGRIIGRRYSVATELHCLFLIFYFVFDVQLHELLAELRRLSGSRLKESSSQSFYMDIDGEFIYRTSLDPTVSYFLHYNC
jgi:hypothetical protein